MIGSQQGCRPCKSEYKYLTDKWSKNKQLKTWYQGKTADQKMQYFRDRKRAMKSGARRTFDIFNFQESQIQQTKDEEVDLEKFLPWTIYRRGRLMDGLSEAEIVAEWEVAIVDPAVPTRIVRGKVCIPEFQGVEARSSKATITESRATRQTSVRSVGELASLKAAAESTHSQTFAALQARAPQLEAAENEPDIDMSDLEGPTEAPAAPAILESSLAKDLASKHREDNLRSSMDMQDMAAAREYATTKASCQSVLVGPLDVGGSAFGGASAACRYQPILCLSGVLGVHSFKYFVCCVVRLGVGILARL